MQKNFKHIDDLLADSYFIEWLCDPSEESDKYWNSLCEKNPHLQSLIPNAKNTFFNIQVESKEVSNTLLDTTLLQVQKQRKVRTLNTATIGKVAAIFILFSLIGTYLLLPQNNFSTEYGKTMALDLKDGSEVILNANSKLSLVNDKGNAANREVWVEGEAFFEITTDPDNPFIVHTSRGDIIVLGTRFNVEDTKEAFSIYLEEGKIRFQPKTEYQKESLDLNVKKHLIFDRSSNSFELRDNNDPNIIAWKDNKIICDNMPLSEISKEIESYYGVPVVIKQDAITDRKLNGIFENTDLDDLALIISEALDINVTKSKKGIEFSHD